MIKLGIFLAVLFVVTFYKIYKDYEGDKKKFALDLGLLLFLLFATGFSKYTRVYLPLFVIHLALTLFAWVWFYLYLWGRTKRILYIFAPILSIGAFFLIGFLASQS